MASPPIWRSLCFAFCVLRRLNHPSGLNSIANLDALLADLQAGMLDNLLIYLFCHLYFHWMAKFVRFAILWHHFKPARLGHADIVGACKSVLLHPVAGLQLVAEQGIACCDPVQGWLVWCCLRRLGYPGPSPALAAGCAGCGFSNGSMSSGCSCFKASRFSMLVRFLPAKFARANTSSICASLIKSSVLSILVWREISADSSFVGMRFPGCDSLSFALKLIAARPLLAKACHLFSLDNGCYLVCCWRFLSLRFWRDGLGGFSAILGSFAWQVVGVKRRPCLRRGLRAQGCGLWVGCELGSSERVLAGFVRGLAGVLPGIGRGLPGIDGQPTCAL